MSTPAPDLLATAIEAHGGAGTWATVLELTIRLRIRGTILAFRGRSPRTRPLSATIDPRRVLARLRPFPGNGRIGVLEGQDVRIEDESGQILRQRTAAERTARRALRWDDLDELYFLAYSLWNYGTTPFLLAWPGVERRELAPVPARDGDWQRLHVRFPPSIPTHCAGQTVYFDSAGLLRRLDYTADVFGPLARGAHLCEAHRSFSGLVMPTYRRVVPRPFGRVTLPGPLAMEGWIDDVTVTRT